MSWWAPALSSVNSKCCTSRYVGITAIATVLAWRILTRRRSTRDFSTTTATRICRRCWALSSASRSRTSHRGEALLCEREGGKKFVAGFFINRMAAYQQMSSPGPDLSRGQFNCTSDVQNRTTWLAGYRPVLGFQRDFKELIFLQGR